MLDAVKVCEILRGLDDDLELLDASHFDNKDIMISVYDAGRYFIMRGQEFTEEEENVKVSPLKLQKLMYYAQGWTHAFTGESLLKKDFQAWMHGPVIPEVYHRYKKYGFNEIDESYDDKVEALNLNGEQLSILNWVWDKYSKFEAKYLERMTHKEQPWLQTRGDLPADAKCNWIIDKEEIFAYFDSLYQTIKLIQEI